jgi:hypothetical protein
LFIVRLLSWVASGRGMLGDACSSRAICGGRATGGCSETFVICDEGRDARAVEARARRRSADRRRARGGSRLTWRRDAILARVDGGAGRVARGEIEPRVLATERERVSCAVAAVRLGRVNPQGRRRLRVQERGAAPIAGLARLSLLAVDTRAPRGAGRGERGV